METIISINYHHIFKAAFRADSRSDDQGDKGKHVP